VQVQPKMFLVNGAVQPVKMHVHGLSTFWLDGVVCNTQGCGDVCLYGSWWLWMTHFDEEVAQWYDFLCIDV
jgi:hypothetical protein